jgi:TonB family protein
MFQALIESGPRPPVSFRRYLASFSIHGLVMVAAVMATRRTLDAAGARQPEVVMPFVISPPAPVPPPEIGPALPQAPRIPAVPAYLPSVYIPQLELPIEGAPTVADVLEGRDFRSESTLDLTRLGSGDSGNPGPLGATAVDDPVDVIRQPAPEYPWALAQAAIPGRVELEYVVDTTGLVEPASLHVLRSTHPSFEAAARASVMASRFRPARLNGRVVRQLVRQTLTFRVRE